MQDREQLQPIAPSNNPEVLDFSGSAAMPLNRSKDKLWPWVVGIILILIGIAAITVYILVHKPPQIANSATVKNQQVDTGKLSPIAGSFTAPNNNTVIVNGQLQAANSIVVVPSAQPTNATLGQIYMDQATKLLYYYNGTVFAPIGNQITNVTNVIGGSTAAGVISLQGAAGDVKLAGTNGLSVSTVGNNISINLPQDLQITASPTFAGITLSAPLSVASGGTGSTSQQAAINSLSGLTTKGDLLYFNGANTTRLALGASADCLTSNGTTLVWGNCSAVAGGANVALSNLSNVAINTALLPQADNTIDLGSAAFSFRSLYGDTSVLTPILDVAAGALNVGTGTATTVTAGSASATLNLQGGLGINIGTANATNTIQIGNNVNAIAQTINIGNNTTPSSSTSIVIGNTIAGTTTLQSAGGVIVPTLGTANTTAYLCRNDSNIISTCQTNTTGSTFVQGGNSFGATAVLGTNDSNSLSFQTNNTTQATIAVGGATTIKNSTDSTAAFQIQNTASATVLGVDTASLVTTATGTLRVAETGGASASLVADSSGNLNITTAGASSVADEFTSTTQDAAWTFSDGTSGGASTPGTNSLIANAGHDTIAVPSGSDHDCWTGGMACPRLMRTGASDGVYETSLDTALSNSLPDTASYSAGIIFHNPGSGNAVRFEYRASSGTVYVKAHKLSTGGTVGTNDVLISSPITMSASGNKLRVIHSGNNYTLSYSLNNGSTWTSVGTFADTDAMTQSGIYTDNAKLGGATAPGLAETFDYFHVTYAEAKLQAGISLFKNTADSTTAFQVQNAAGTKLIGVDTTGNGTIDIQGAADSGIINIATANSLAVTIGKSGGTGTLTVNGDSTYNGNLTVASSKDIKLAGSGNARNALTKDFTCTSSEAANDIVAITGAGTVGRTTTAADPKVAGVVVAKANSTSCTIAIAGEVQVWFSGNAAPGFGDAIETSTTAGAAEKNAAPTVVGSIVGKATDNAKDGSNLVWILLGSH